jgi:hypothetical protein
MCYLKIAHLFYCVNALVNLAWPLSLTLFSRAGFEGLLLGWLLLPDFAQAFFRVVEVGVRVVFSAIVRMTC